MSVSSWAELSGLLKRTIAARTLFLPRTMRGGRDHRRQSWGRLFQKLGIGGGASFLVAMLDLLVGLCKTRQRFIGSEQHRRVGAASPRTNLLPSAPPQNKLRSVFCLNAATIAGKRRQLRGEFASVTPRNWTKPAGMLVCGPFQSRIREEPHETQRKKQISLAAACAAATLATCGWRKAQDVKIGLILPMTGQQQSTGKQESAGAKLWMAQHGDTMGARKIEAHHPRRRRGPRTIPSALRRICSSTTR